jgi:hypothetical protein
MQPLASHIDVNSKEFQVNAEFNRTLLIELKKKTEKEDSNTLKEIADNTGKTADRLSLRTQTLGGGELAKLGITGTELGSGGSPDVSGLISARNKLADSRPAESTIRSAPTQLEEAVSGVVRLNIKRGMGTSTRL